VPACEAILQQGRTVTDDPRLYLLDGSSYFFRAFHAGARLTRSDGLPTNAVFVVAKMVLKLLKDEKPSHLVAAFDVKGGTFRNQLYPAYKAHRPPMPQELAVQFEPTLEVLRALGIPLLTAPGYEADDIIATLARQGRQAGMQVVIVSGDKDLAQLVGEGVTMLDTLKGVRYDPAGVREKWGVWPNQVRDLLALKGDASDNIPGVSGVGDKTAAKLLHDFGSLEKLQAALPELRNPKLKERLEKGWADLELSRTLVTLHEQVPLAMGPHDAHLVPADPSEVRRVFARYEFSALAAELALSGDLGPRPSPSPSSPAPSPASAAGPAQLDLLGALPAPVAAPSADLPPPEYVCVDTLEALDALLAEARRLGVVAIDTETTGLDVLTARLVGVSLSVAPRKGWYVPLAHHTDRPQLSWDDVRPRLAALLATPGLLRVGHNLKFDGSILAAHGLDLGAPCFDTMLASYLLSPQLPTHKLDACAARELGRDTLPFAQVAPDARFDGVDLDTATRYSGEDVDLALCLYERYAPALAAADLTRLFDTVEVPLAPVLGAMERAGIRVDAARLQTLGHELRIDLQRLERTCYEAAGQAFNLNSPKQLAEVLFTKLKLPVVKKTKSGPSTDVTVLEELADQHPLPAKILEYRHLAKLLGTYVDVLPTLVHPVTGRIHTSYNQTVAATGRLSSSDPNLQNIPVRTETGRKIRQAFVPAQGHVFVSADYSQIELRVLAHLADDPSLIDAFVKGEDIHTRTASEIFGVPPGEVTREQRGRAKTINFGVLYGMSAFRLAREFGVPRADAKAFIDQYFGRYPGIQRYIDRTLDFGRRHGYVTTLFGRRRPIADLTATNRNEAQAAERVAINTPVQGTAADMIKLAMVTLADRLRTGGFAARLVLQVHDELMLEAPEAEAAAVQGLVREVMEGVATLKVPLKVDSGVGRTWAEAHG
jgi:DNA polymerase-1